MNFILSSDTGIVKDTEVVGDIKISDHRQVRAKITIKLKRARMTLFVRKQANLDVVMAKIEEFRIAPQNKYEALEQKEYQDTEKMNGNITKLIAEATFEEGGKALREDVNTLSQTTKNLIKQCQLMGITNSGDKIG